MLALTVASEFFGFRRHLEKSDEFSMTRIACFFAFESVIHGCRSLPTLAVKHSLSLTNQLESVLKAAFAKMCHGLEVGIERCAARDFRQCHHMIPGIDHL